MGALWGFCEVKVGLRRPFDNAYVMFYYINKDFRSEPILGSFHNLPFFNGRTPPRNLYPPITPQDLSEGVDHMGVGCTL